MSMRRIISLIESKDDAISVDWEIYKPFPDDSPEQKAKYKDWRKVSSALDSAANKAAAQVIKGATIYDVWKKFFEPVAEKYSDYGVYDSEVDRQWTDVVNKRVRDAKALFAARFRNK